MTNTPPTVHELTGDVGLTESERALLGRALDLVADDMDDYTDAEADAFNSLRQLADPDQAPEAGL